MKAFQLHRDPRPTMEIDDIPGARPVKRQYLKKIYRQKHQQQIRKFKRPQLQILGDVYLQSRSQLIQNGLPKFFNLKASQLHGSNNFLMNPEYNQNRIMKPQWSKVDLSQSMPLELIEQKSSSYKFQENLYNKPQSLQSKQFNKIIFSNEPQNNKSKQSLSKSAILSSSGLKSFATQSLVKNNPYFPQIYHDDKQMGYSPNKMTGNRYWNGQATNSVSLGKNNNGYYPKWS